VRAAEFAIRLSISLPGPRAAPADAVETSSGRSGPRVAGTGPLGVFRPFERPRSGLPAEPGRARHVPTIGPARPAGHRQQVAGPIEGITRLAKFSRSSSTVDILVAVDVLAGPGCSPTIFSE